MIRRAFTVSVSIPADTARVFAFLSDPANLPRWATRWCASITRQPDGTWLAQTSAGTLNVVYVTHAECGVIDLHVTPPGGEVVVLPSRVVPNQDGAEYTLLDFQRPDVTDEHFRRQQEGLQAELDGIPALLAAEGRA